MLLLNLNIIFLYFNYNMASPDQKQFKVIFNGTKKESIAEGGQRFTKFVGNLIRQFAKVVTFILLLYRLL